MLIRALSRLKTDVDPGFVLYQYIKESEIESDAWETFDTMPKTITQLNKLAKGFFPSDKGGRLYLKIRCGFDLDVEEFCLSSRVVLKDFQGSLYLKKIQVASSESVGWCIFSDMDMGSEYWEEQIDLCFKSLATSEKYDKKARVPCDSLGSQVLSALQVYLGWE